MVAATNRLKAYPLPQVVVEHWHPAPDWMERGTLAVGLVAIAALAFVAGVVVGLMF